MTPAILAGTLLTLATTGAAPSPWTVCLVEREAVPGASAGEVGDALVVEARKRGREARLLLAPDAAACGDAVVVTLAEPVRVDARAAVSALSLGPLRELDRAAAVARAVVAALGEGGASDAALVGELPPPALPVVAPPVAVTPVPVASPEGAGAPEAAGPLSTSVGLMAAADPGESSLFGRLEVQLTGDVLSDWLALGVRVDLATPADASAGGTRTRRVELGAHGLVALRGALGVGLAVSGELDVGVSHRWTSATADEVEPYPATSTDRGEAVASVGAGVWLAWEPGAGPLWLAVGASGRRYLGGTDLAAPAGRVDAPRWSLDGGLRVGVRL